MVTWRQLSIVILAWTWGASALAQFKPLTLVSSVVTLRMGHLPLGRFDTIGKNALVGSFEVKGDEVRLRTPRLKFNIESLHSPVEVRDNEMKVRLDAATYPQIEISDFKASLKAQTFSGLMTVRQTSLPIQGAFVLNKKNFVNASFVAQLDKLGFAPPSYMGVGVENEFEVLLELQFAEPGDSASGER